MPTAARLATALALAVFVPCTAAADWKQLQSENFLFIGDAGEHAMRGTAQKLELFREAMLRAIPGASMTSPVPTIVVVFANDESLRPYRPQFRGRAVEVAGWFSRNEDINYIAINAEEAARAFKVIFHEYSHFLVGNWADNVPVWMNEGLAEVYSTFQERDGGRSALLGAPDTNHTGLLRSSMMIPIPELLAIDHSSPAYNEGIRRGVLYAESWALVHYLMFGNEGRKAQLATYLTAVKSGTAGAEAFRSAFGDLPTLEKELRTYISEFRLPAVRAVFSDKVVAAVAAPLTPMAASEAASYLGDLLARLERSDEARKHLRGVLAKNADSARAACALGLIELREKHLDEAVPLLERAAALAPDDAWIQTAFGRALMVKSEDSSAEETDALRQRARAVLSKAAALDRTSAYTLMLLARAEMTPGGDPRVVSASLEHALQLVPARQEYRLMLAESLIRQAEYARATDHLGPLVARGHTDVRDRAREMLAEIARRAHSEELAGSTDRAAPAATNPDGVRTPAVDDAPSRLGNQPVFRAVGAGETRVFGIFKAVDCTQQGLVFRIESDSRAVRLSAARFEDVEFISYRRVAPGTVSCGNQQAGLRVFATFRAETGTGSRLDGRAVAIEVVDDDFVPR